MGLKLELAERSILNTRDTIANPSRFLETAVALQTDGKPCNEHVMVLMKEVLGNLSASQATAETKRVHHLFFYFVSNLKKREGSKILAEVLLLVNQIRKDVLSVNCYTRVRAMRCVASFISLQPVVDNFYSAIKENVTHSSFLVRRCAASLISRFFCSDIEKYADAFPILKNRLTVEDNPYVTREILRSLSDMANFRDRKKSSTEISDDSKSQINGQNIERMNYSHTKNDVDSLESANTGYKKDLQIDLKSKSHDFEMNIVKIYHSSNRDYNRILSDYISRTPAISVPVLEYIVNTTENLGYVFENLNIVTFHAGMRLLREFSGAVSNKGSKSLSTVKKNPNISSKGYLGPEKAAHYDLSRMVTALLESSRAHDAIEEIIERRYPTWIIKGNISAILELLKNKNQYQNAKTLSYIYTAAVSSEDFENISDFLSTLLEKSTDGTQKVEILKAINILYENYAYISKRTVDFLRLLLNSEIPSIAFEALKIISNLQSTDMFSLKSRNIDFDSDLTQMIDFRKIRYGKIFRKALSLVSDKISSEQQVCKFISMFESALNYDSKTGTFKISSDFFNSSQLNSSKSKNFERISGGSEKRPILTSLECKSTPFIGTSVALFFEKIYHNVEISQTTVAHVIALLLLFINHGKIYDKIDSSSESIIYFCIQSISDRYTALKTKRTFKESQDVINPNNRQVEDVLDRFKYLDFLFKGDSTQNRFGQVTQNITAPIVFPFLPYIYYQTQTTPIPKKRDTIQQLSSVSDPIFIESRITITGFIATINVVFLNRAKSALQNISLDLTASQNLSLVTNMNFNTLQPEEMKTAELRASINECSDAFITGNVSFVFLKNKQYTGKYSINLVPIKLYIRDFLIPNHLDNEFFLDNWPKLEWENTYTIKIHPAKIKLNARSKNISTLIEKIRHELKGNIVDSFVSEKYAVCNLVCRTTLENTILLNFIFTNEDLLNVEARIRSDSEDVVKSISKILSSIIKK